MIGKLRGYIDCLEDDKCIIDVNGVGYLVSISSKTSQFLASSNHSSEQEKNQVSLIIETVVKEDSIELFGFSSQFDRKWFLEITKVQGVGAKVGLKILSYFSISDLAKALISQNSKEFCKVPGIGPKLGQRIVTELKDSPKKLGVGISAQFDQLSDLSSGGKDFASLPSDIANDALSALENLGYKKAEASLVIEQIISNEPEIALENLITDSLRSLSKRRG